MSSQGGKQSRLRAPQLPATCTENLVSFASRSSLSRSALVATLIVTYWLAPAYPTHVEPCLSGALLIAVTYPALPNHSKLLPSQT